MPIPTILPLSPMATLLSAHLAQRSEKVLGTGHGRGRPQELLSPFGAVAPEPASGMMVTGTMSGIFMSGKTIPNVPGLLHPREPDTYVFAVHEDGHTKMAAFKIPGPTATPVFMDGRAHVGKLLPVDAGAIGDTWDSAQNRNVRHEEYKVTSIMCRPSPQGASANSIAVVPSQATPILKEIARLDALATQGCTIDDRVYATKIICIARAFYAYTSLGRHTERIRRLVAQDAALARKAGEASEVENTLVSIVQMAYKLTTARAARSQTDIMGGQIIVSTIQSLWRALGTQQQLMLSHALREILELEQPDGLVAKLSEVCDRAPRCSSAQKQAFNLLIQHAGKLTDAASRKQGTADAIHRDPIKGYVAMLQENLWYILGHKPAGETVISTPVGRSPVGTPRRLLPSTIEVSELDCREGALERLYAVFGDYLDEHKERAFKSAFEEPARFYFDCVDDAAGRDHVNVHGLNWYLAHAP